MSVEKIFGDAPARYLSMLVSSTSLRSAILMQVDNEYAGHLPDTVQIVKNALTFLLPPHYKGRVKHE